MACGGIGLGVQAEPSDPLSAEAGSVPREQLVYSVSWSGMVVGKIVATDYGMVTLRDRPCLKLVADAKTDGAIEKIYKDRRKYIGYLTAPGEPWIYEEWEQDKDGWRMEEWLGFFSEEKRVRRYKKGKVRNTLEIPERAFDPVAAVHYLRSLDLEPGRKYEATVTQGKYLYNATMNVVEGETLSTPIGEVKTVVAYPKLYWKGKPLGKREFKVWFSDDDRSIPVRLFADVEYGSFSAELIRYRTAETGEEPFTSPG